MHNASVGLTTAVGNRAYPITAPQNPVYPYYTFQRISTPQRVGSHGGDSKLEQVRVQFTPNAKTAIEADAIAETIKAAYIGLTGVYADQYIGGVTFAGDLDDYEPLTKTYKRMIDLYIWLRPAP